MQEERLNIFLNAKLFLLFSYVFSVSKEIVRQHSHISIFTDHLREYFSLCFS